MLNILSQMEYPVLLRPFLTLHPWRIAEPNIAKIKYSVFKHESTIWLYFDLEYAKQFNLNQITDLPEIP